MKVHQPTSGQAPWALARTCTLHAAVRALPGRRRATKLAMAWRPDPSDVPADAACVAVWRTMHRASGFPGSSIHTSAPASDSRLARSATRI